MEHQYKLPLYTLSVFNFALKGVLLKKIPTPIQSFTYQGQQKAG